MEQKDFLGITTQNDINKFFGNRAQQLVKENAETFTSGEDVLKKPAVSIHEQEPTIDVASLTDGSRERAFGEALATLVCSVADHGQFSAETKAAIRSVATLYASDTAAVAKLAHEGMTRLSTALHTVEGNYQWLAKNFLVIRVPSRPGSPYVFTADLSTKRTYPTLDALVTAERERV